MNEEALTQSGTVVPKSNKLLLQLQKGIVGLVAEGIRLGEPLAKHYIP